MSAITFAIAAALFHLAPVQTVKKCEKIDACRCSTDEGEINLWSLGSESPGQPRFNFAEASTANISGKTKDSYQWNPCYSWTAQTLPKEDAKNHCKNVAVCLTQKTSPYGTFRVNIGEQNLSDCVYDVENGRCRLTYRVQSDKQKKTSIDLICKDTEEGRVDVMKTFGSFYYTSLYSKCACPGRCSGLSSGAIAGIVIGSIVAFLILAFVVFICYVRCMLADVETKPSIWTTIKDGFILIKETCCPCFRRRQYSQIP
ncbi:hypothetical protein ABFA07_018886 [Porites harrisoni]